MKKIQLLLTIIISLISTITFAQDDEWSNHHIFDRAFKNNMMISDQYANKNEAHIYGKESYINDQNQKMLNLIKIDTKSNRVVPYLTGEIENLKIKRSFQRDSTIFIYKMNFTWNVHKPEEKIFRKVKAQETSTIDLLSEQIITTIQIDFPDSKEDFYAWNEESFAEENGEKGISFPLFLKIKKIAYANEGSNEPEEMEHPEEIITYALWTNNAFYRYAITGLKDKVEFAKQTDSVNTTSYNTSIYYEDTNGKPRLYMNNYYRDDPKEYVSTIDVNQFPAESEKPLIPFGTMIIWEKLDVVEKYTNLSLKLDFIGEKGFSTKEINNMKKEKRILESMHFNIKNEH